MSESVGLHQLVGAVAGAIVDAQGLVEQHYIAHVRRYFGSDGRPVCMGISIPRPSTVGSDETLNIAVPLLSLVESQMLAIRDMRIELDVELGALIDAPVPMAPLAATGGGVPAAPLGAPVAFPEIGPALPGPPPAGTTASAPLAGFAPAPTPLPAKLLTLGVGSRQDGAPRARLSINVAAHPPSEGMLRLFTQLNKLV